MKAEMTMEESKKFARLGVIRGRSGFPIMQFLEYPDTFGNDDNENVKGGGWGYDAMKLSLAVGMELLSEIWNNEFVKDKRVILREAIKKGEELFMKREAKDEGGRWLIHARDEFQDADELRNLFNWQRSWTLILKK